MKKFLLYFVGLFLLMQLIQTEKKDQIIDTSVELNASSDVMNILKRSCYDCHSQNTRWPTYSYIAPFSWIISSNVKSGRAAIDFSKWSLIKDEIKIKRVKRMRQLINNGMMPKSEYLLFHSEAKLKKSDIELLTKWINKRILK